MKIQIYYGGRGLIEDPTIYVMNKLASVFDDLHVEVQRFNLYEQKNGITMLPSHLKEADAIILAAHVEWFGIGGLLQQFLDSCWLYADKGRIEKLYMMPVVISDTCGERDAEACLKKAWELLGGICCDGITAYVDNRTAFETGPEYASIIEQKAEQFYKTVNRHVKSMPASAYALRGSMLTTNSIALTPQEGEQLSVFVSDDTYVKKQKEDIEELTLKFKEMLEGSGEEENREFLKNLRDNYKPQGEEFEASYLFRFSDTDRSLVIEVSHNKLKCFYGEKEDAEVVVTMTRNTMNKLVNGRTTLQGAFMSSDLTAKGNFKTLRTFDQVFQFTSI